MRAQLNIRRPSTPPEVRTLDPSQPLSVGRHAASDIWLDEEGVALLHCRIGWNPKDGYEVTAAGTDGVDVNGRRVRRATLRPGDVLRVGSVDLVFEDSPATRDADNGPESAVEFREWRAEERPSQAAKAPTTALRPASPAASAAPPGAATETPPTDVEPDPWERDAPAEDSSMRRAEPSLLDDLKARIGATPRRPGEQDVLRSPGVLLLGSGVLVLLLAAAVFWFIVGRQAGQRLFDAAAAELEIGKYADAIALFEQFLLEHPTHALAPAARVELGRAQIERQLASAPPDWRAGLEELKAFIDRHRDDEDFRDRYELIRALAGRIALGAADSAAERKERALLALVTEAKDLLVRYSPPDERPEELEQRIELELQRATDAVRKQEAFEAALAEIEGAVTRRRPIESLAARRRLLERFPDAADSPQVADLLRRTLDLERTLVAAVDADVEPSVEERPSDRSEPWSRVVASQVQRGAAGAEARTVIAAGNGCCIGLDAETGRPRWRRVVGLDAPFFPKVVPSRTPGVLLFDTRHGELQLVEHQTGRLTWRTELGARPAGEPLVWEGQVVLTTEEGHLWRLDLETGEVSGRLAVSQPFSTAAVVLGEGGRVAVAGQEELLYVFSLRPLECVGVSHLGHRPGSISAPPQPLGRLLLVAENDRLQSCLLRALEADDAGQFREVGSARVMGTVRDPLVLRGNLLCVPSSGQRVSVFVATDRPGEPPLSELASQAFPEAGVGTLSLSAGPDGQVWLAGGALRSLQIDADKLRPAGQPVAAGKNVGPLGAQGRFLHLGRRPPQSGGILFSRIDREELTTDWQTSFAVPLAAMGRAGSDSAVCVADTGEVFRVTAQEVQRGGFAVPTATRLDLPEELVDPLAATLLPEGRVAVWCGNPRPRLWLIGQSGQVEQQTELEAPLEAEPVQLGNAGLILPLPGRLKLLAADAAATVEDFRRDIGPEPSAWAWVVATDDEHLIVIDRRGRATRIELREAPIPHLYGVAEIDLGSPVDVGPAARDGSLFYAVGRTVNQIDPVTLEIQSQAELPEAATSDLTLVDGRVLVEAGHGTLISLGVADGLREQWRVDWPTSEGLAGPPVAFDGRLAIARRSGEVLLVDLTTGEVAERVQLPLPAALGPVPLEDLLVIPTVDGSLYHVEPGGGGEP